MKMRKTILAAALATAMVASLGTTAFAADASATKTESGETKVTYAVTESYTWTVPAEVTFGKDAGVNKNNVDGKATDNSSELKVTVTNNVIENDKKLRITAVGDGTSGAFTIKTTEGASLTYKIQLGSDKKELTDGTVLEVPAGQKEGSVDLTFTLTTASTTAEIAGNYEGKVIYTASAAN